jgi:hypothetical protein
MGTLMIAPRRDSVKICRPVGSGLPQRPRSPYRSRPPSTRRVDSCPPPTYRKSQMNDDPRCPDATLLSSGLFGRYLTVWVALCIVAGVAIGQFLPAVPETLARFTYAQVSCRWRS